ncbi:MAG: serine hydrolase [Calditrichia bacterium]|nr:serine hydrolase [Calditrichia bacterium]
MIENITGKSYEDVLIEKIINPLEMSNSGFIYYDRSVSKMTTSYMKDLQTRRLHFYNFKCNGASSIYSTIEDLHLYSKGLAEGKLLSAKYKTILFTPSFPKENPFYSYGGYYPKVNFNGVEKAIIASSGGGRNIIYMIPRDNHLVVILNNKQCPKLDEICYKILMELHQ